VRPADVVGGQELPVYQEAVGDVRPFTVRL
jgi:hypothetical protein